MKLEIKFVPGINAWVVLLTGLDGHHAYFHTDGQWRQNCVGPEGYSGHWTDEEHANRRLTEWLRGLPEFTHDRNRRIVRVRPRRPAVNLENSGN
jgi:hypothetical protein